MSPKSAFAVPNERIQEHAERVLSGPVTRRELALGFFESSASSAEVLVEGRSFYPRMLEDIASATSSIHINQFGFRPGIVGDAFADALIEKAAKGIAVRLVVDRQGSDPERGSRVLYDRLAAADVEVCVMRPTQARARVGPLGRGGATRWNLTALGHVDHRKVAVIDGRIGWVGGAGIEDHFQDGRFLDLFVRVAGPVVAQLQLVFLVSFHWLGGEIPSPSSTHFSHASRTAMTRLLHGSFTTLPGGSGRSPMRSRRWQPSSGWWASSRRAATRTASS
jgi:cardiolipin synthase A/B